MRFRDVLLGTACKAIPGGHLLPPVPIEAWESATNGPWCFALLGRHAEDHMDPARVWRVGDWRADGLVEELYPVSEPLKPSD